MLNRKNTYFESLRKLGTQFDEKKTALKEKKLQIIETYGWDSDELKAWYEEDKSLTYPVPQGACKAYRAFQSTIEKEEDEVFMDDFLWDREVADFIEALRKAGIESFIYTNQSTAMMENLHGFEAEGCKMEGLAKITRTERRFGENREEQILGVRFSL